MFEALKEEARSIPSCFPIALKMASPASARASAIAILTMPPSLMSESTSASTMAGTDSVIATMRSGSAPTNSRIIFLFSSGPFASCVTSVPTAPPMPGTIMSAMAPAPWLRS
jgi:hypothetical protein